MIAIHDVAKSNEQMWVFENMPDEEARVDRSDLIFILLSALDAVRQADTKPRMGHPTINRLLTNHLSRPYLARAQAILRMVIRNYTIDKRGSSGLLIPKTSAQSAGKWFRVFPVYNERLDAKPAEQNAVAYGMDLTACCEPWWAAPQRRR